MHMCNLCFLSVFGVVFLYSFLRQYFATVGWVFCPVKTVDRITYIVLVQTLSHAHSISQSQQKCKLYTLSYAVLMLHSVWWIDVYWPTL